MSVILTTDQGWVINHETYINNSNKLISDNGLLKRFIVNPKLFYITSKFLRPEQTQLILDAKPNSAKRRKLNKNTKTIIKSDYEGIYTSARTVESKFLQILDHAKCIGLFKKVENDGNEAAKLFAREFYENTARVKDKKYDGGNSSSETLLIDLNNEKYLIPPNCFFYNYDIREIGSRLDKSIKYDSVLLDPPWWNKYIRRKKNQGSDLSYSMLHNLELAEIPIQNMLKPNALVVIWCTNAPSHLEAIDNELFPKWGLTKEATWFWIKLTMDGKPICDFAPPPAKQPFEQIIFGRKIPNDNIQMNSLIPRIPDEKVILSVPSALHSHKPNLKEILSQYLPEDPVCLELFARSLQSNWTSYGLETLRLQHISLYKEIDIQII